MRARVLLFVVCTALCAVLVGGCGGGGGGPAQMTVQINLAEFPQAPGQLSVLTPNGSVPVTAASSGSSRRQAGMAQVEVPFTAGQIQVLFLADANDVVYGAAIGTDAQVVIDAASTAEFPVLTAAHLWSPQVAQARAARQAVRGHAEYVAMVNLVRQALQDGPMQPAITAADVEAPACRIAADTDVAAAAAPAAAVADADRGVVSLQPATTDEAEATGITITGPFNGQDVDLSRVQIEIQNALPRPLVAYRQDWPRTGSALPPPVPLSPKWIEPAYTQGTRTTCTLDFITGDLRQIDLYFYGPGGVGTMLPPYWTEQEKREAHARLLVHAVPPILDFVVGFSGVLLAEVTAAFLATAEPISQYEAALQAGDQAAAVQALKDIMADAALELAADSVQAARALEIAKQAWSAATVTRELVTLGATRTTAKYTLVAARGDSDWNVDIFPLSFSTAYAFYDRENDELSLAFNQGAGVGYPFANIGPLESASGFTLNTQVPTSAVAVLVDANLNHAFAGDEEHPCFLVFTRLELRAGGRISGTITGELRADLAGNDDWQRYPMRGRFTDVPVIVQSPP